MEAEERLLLDVARARDGETVTPPADLRVDRLLRLARLHGMTPLVARAMGAPVGAIEVSPE